MHRDIIYPSQITPIIITNEMMMQAVSYFESR